jgi:dolichyldiphosphatase
MPSTHSTALGFYLVYLWPLLPLISSSFLAPTTELWVERAALLAITGLGLWSRVALGYHTLAQVLAGTTVGTVGALVWARTWATHPDIGPVIQSIIDTSRERALTLVT